MPTRKSKRKRTLNDRSAKQQNEAKKSKWGTPVDDFVDELKKLQRNNKFGTFDKIGSTIKFAVSNANKNVNATVEIWNATELLIYISFAKQKEAVIVDDPSFGKSIRRLTRLQNIIDKIKRVHSCKEELFQADFNWAAVIQCNSVNFDNRFFPGS